MELNNKPTHLNTPTSNKPDGKPKIQKTDADKSQSNSQISQSTAKEDLKKLSVSQLNKLGSADLNKLNSSQLAKLNNSQLNKLNPTKLAQVPASKLKTLADSILSKLSDSQLQRLGLENKRADKVTLSEEGLTKASKISDIEKSE